LDHAWEGSGPEEDAMNTRVHESKNEYIIRQIADENGLSTLRWEGDRSVWSRLRGCQ